MFRPRVIPTLLLKQRGLVKTIGFADASYVGDPINAVKIFNDSEADELIFLDIEATAEGRLPPAQLIRQISDEAFMPFTIGGGIRSADDVRAVFDLGAEKVAINTAAVEDPGLIEEASRVYGSQALIASLDARREDDGSYQVYTRSGSRPSGLSPAEAARRAQEHGAGEVLITSIDRDGTGEGFDLELVGQVADAVSIPVIACGGAGDYDELATPIAAGASAVAAGSLFVYIGSKRAVLINYPDRDELTEMFEAG